MKGLVTLGTMVNVVRLRGGAPAKAFKRSLTACVLLFVISCTGLSVAQRTIRVPQDQPSIQAGIDAASNGDTVLVLPGSYTEQLNFKGKAITVTTGATSYSAPEVAATVIHAMLNPENDIVSPIASFFSNEGRGTVLNGFTLTSPTQAYFYQYGQPLVAVSVLNSLVAPFSTGPGPAGPGTPTITNNRFVGDANPVGLVGGVVAGNYFGGGSGFYVISVGKPDHPVESNVHDNVIENNHLTRQSLPTGDLIGAILYASHALVYNNTIRDNTVTTLAAGARQQFLFPGVGFQLAEPFVFAQNLVYGNQMDIQFSIALGADPGIQEIVANNTIADNAPSSVCTETCTPGQMLFTKSAAFAGNDVIVANNIMRAGPGAGPTFACVDDSAGPYLPAMQDTLQVDHNLFAPSSQPVFDASCRQQIVNAGNLLSDPQFESAEGGNYRLEQGSPAVDAGNNSILAQLSTFPDSLLTDSLTTDLEGQPRPTDATGKSYPTIDMGAYELPGTQSDAPTSLLLIPQSYPPTGTRQAILTGHLSSPSGVPTGTVTLMDNGNPTSTASVQADGTTVFHVTELTSGIHEFIASYPGSQRFAPAISLKLVLPFDPLPTSLLLLPAPQTSAVGTAVTFHVVATAQDGSVPSPVTLTDSNGQTLGTVYPDPYGNGSLVVNNLPPGNDTVTATYAGTGRYAAATATSTVVVTNKGFSITLNPASLSLRAGQQGTSTAVVTSLGSFAGTLRLSVDPGSEGVFASLGTTSLTLAPGATGSSTLTVSTFSSAQTASTATPGRRPPWVLFAVMFASPFAWRRRRQRLGALALVVGTVAIVSLGGCTNLRIPRQPLPPGTYLIPVTATDSAGNSHKATLTLLVTK